jgi:Flp pilus assembly protein TadG
VLSPTARPGRRSGNILVLFAVFLTGLIGTVAFSIDTGYIALTKTRLQRTADAAALAGAEMTATVPGQTQDPTAIKNEVKKFANLNSPDLTILDSDIVLCRYTPYYAAGSRLSYDLTTKPANAVRVTMRRDSTANNPLGLFFAPVIGTRSVELSATAFAYIMPAAGILPQAPVIPYAVQANYYYTAIGQTGLNGVDNKKITVADNYIVNPGTYQVTAGHDGINEVMLFSDASISNPKPGNFGSINIGSASNSATALQNQVLYGPTVSDFTNPDFVTNVAADGALYVPFNTTGDPGLSTTVKSSFDAITGQPRIIPLYDTTTLTGTNTVFHIISYAGVVVVNVDFTGSPKKIWVQPAFLVSNKVTAVTSDSQTTSYGVYTPPKLVIP